MSSHRQPIRITRSHSVAIAALGLPCLRCLFRSITWFFLVLVSATNGHAALVEFNSTGGTNATNGLHFYIEDTTKIQVRRLNNTGQVYLPTAIPPNPSLDNGIFIRANGLVYGPSHNVGAVFNPTGGNYNTFSISATTPANPASPGVQQSATGNFGINAGPRVSVVWRYTTPLDFLTAEVTLTIPAGYPVSAANPVRYYHVFDTFLGGSDSGCGVRFVDSNNHVVVGTYPPPVGTSCPSSTSIPAGVTIVESFRERSGRSFSNFCTAVWSSFFNNGAPNCSVNQAAAMSNTIVTTFQDTGIGIQYDFTASGTYTFSYDFVIGSTAVPAYDHIEIRHDGSATLCPENVTVLACTSTILPCPVANIVTTGTITGNIVATPSTPAFSPTPSSFSIGGSGSVGGSAQTISFQGAAPGGTYTLSANGISGTPPLNGTRCWNGSSSSCSIVVSNTPCLTNFECLESGLTYNNLTAAPSARNPLYTKIAGTPFSFDVVALQTGGVQSSSYVANNVRVELFDDNPTFSTTCPNPALPAIATFLINFQAADNGRKNTGAITVNQAARRLRCKVTDTSLTPNVSGCSSDTFTVRPSAITSVTSSNATADSVAGISPTNLPIIKAGASFNLTADSGVPGYNGIPEINSNLIAWGNQPVGGRPAPSVGTVAGVFGAAVTATGNGAAGGGFTYDEVGYFQFRPQGVFDSTFAASSNDIANGDCTRDFSNTLSTGSLGNPPNRYGCYFGNTAVTNYFGRFIPDHFRWISDKTTPGCGSGSAAFTYMDMDQTFEFSGSVEAQNSAGIRTLNYSGNFAKATVAPQLENNNSGVPISVTRLGSDSPGWSGGNFPFKANKFIKLTAPDGPYESLAIGLVATDEAGQVLLQNRNMDASNTVCTPDPNNTSNGNCPAVTIGTTNMRFGRVNLSNAFGSELLPLNVPLRLEYWAGSNAGWRTNTLDVCSNFTASQFAFAFPAGTSAKSNNLAACETTISVAGSPPRQTLRLSAPGASNNGWTDLTLNLGPIASGTQCVAPSSTNTPATTANFPWLQFNWFGTGVQNPRVRANFGVYKNANEFIYLREIH